MKQEKNPTIIAKSHHGKHTESFQSRHHKLRRGRYPAFMRKFVSIQVVLVKFDIVLGMICQDRGRG